MAGKTPGSLTMQAKVPILEIAAKRSQKGKSSSISDHFSNAKFKTKLVIGPVMSIKSDQI